MAADPASKRLDCRPGMIASNFKSVSVTFSFNSAPNACINSGSTPIRVLLSVS